MRKPLLTAAMTLAIAASTACSDVAPEPVALDTAALIASAPAWTPADITRDLPVDDATRAQIEDGLRTLHTTLLELHARVEAADALDGDAHAASMEALQEELHAMHAEHHTLWESLDTAVRETLHERLHERAHQHETGALKSFHERMQRMHGNRDGHN